MIEWKHAGDLILLGTEADATLAAAISADIMGDWPPGTVLRTPLTADRVAWLWRTGEGSLTCLATAPRGSGWDCDIVDGIEFFGRPMPDDWISKQKAGIVKKGYGDGRKPRRPKLGYDAGWACGQFNASGPDSKPSVVFAKVAAFNGARLISVYTEDDGPAVPVERHAAVRWWPAGQWGRGLDLLWRRGQRTAPAWSFLCGWAARAEAQADRKAEKAAKLGEGSKPTGKHGSAP